MNIIPKPSRLEPRPDPFVLEATTAIVAGPGTQVKAEQLAAALRPATGFALPVVTEARAGAIALELDAGLERLGAEGYTLEVRGDGVTLRAPTVAGLFYAGQSLRQLLPTAIFSAAPATGVAWTVPGVFVEDQPRFAWRGAMLDVCRHFMPLEFVKKFIDLLALHKLNTFHWHLSEDQGWRLEIKKYPRLTEVGAWRKQTMEGHYSKEPRTFDGVRHGGFYTQDEVREVVAYAALRHVTVVPEIEMPGHAQAAIAAYPELGNTGATLEVWDQWGINENVYNVEESTLAFLEDVLTEVIALFPGRYIHVGGDECPKTQWRESPKAQARMRELGFTHEDQLQSHIIGRMDRFLHERGRKLVGWDEILEGGLAPNATVMSWRGVAGGIAAAKAGHDVVMSPTTHAYLDYYQADPAHEPVAIGGLLTLEGVYAFDPVVPELEGEEAKRVLGGQANLWTEYVPTPEHAEYMLFPRLCAFAETVWTDRSGRQFAEFSGRLGGHLERLGHLGVNHWRPKGA